MVVTRSAAAAAAAAADSAAAAAADCSCCVCLEPFGDAVMFTPICGHVLHKKCAFRVWITSSTSCTPHHEVARPVDHVGVPAPHPAFRCPICRSDTVCSDTIWGVDGAIYASEMFVELRTKIMFREPAAGDEFYKDMSAFHVLACYADSVLTRSPHGSHGVPVEVVLVLSAELATTLRWCRYEMSVVTNDFLTTLCHIRDNFLLVRREGSDEMLANDHITLVPV
jgi:hypothetical protein